MDSFSLRLRVYCSIACTLFLFSTLLSFVQAHYLDSPFTYIRSDGRAYYMYLPSIIIDKDLDFANQLSNRWNIQHSPLDSTIRTSKGYIVNRYPLGLALTISPAFLVAHCASNLLYSIGKISFFSPDGYTIIYQFLCSGFIMFLGLLSILMIDSLLEKRFGIEGKEVGIAVILFWLVSNYAYYYFREPFMAHIVSGFWVVLTIYLINFHARLKKDGSASVLFLILFSFSMAIVCRPTNVFLVIFLCIFVWDLVNSKLLVKYLKNYLPICIVALLPFFIQMYVWYKTTGNPFHYSYGEVGFDWANPVLLKTVFSSRHGLFFWSPILVLSILGFLMVFFKEKGYKDIFLLSLFMSFLILWYANSAWKYWWFGDAFGARAFIELLVFWVVGIGYFLKYLKNMNSLSQRIVHCSIGLCILYNYTMMALYILSFIPRGDYLI